MSVTRADIYTVVTTATGHPQAGPMFDAVDAIVDALDLHINGPKATTTEVPAVDTEPVKVTTK
ncbi:hypothetical protein UFOVP199_48 [uncultured Caudovirales phage]|uniref:Uncharacterized protein n=1 Tax=uncultured Caudovirales phage TaxID=2100421 RepID=A0A6J7WLR1_9CAUD|nr:hypothetical protein UFOVP199_48 [uncultured Caudovirales phage]